MQYEEENTQQIFAASSHKLTISEISGRKKNQEHFH